MATKPYPLNCNLNRDVFPLQLLEFHGEAVDGKAVASAWLGALPLTADELEAAVAHEQLVRLVEASDPRCDIWAILHVPTAHLSINLVHLKHGFQLEPGVLHGRCSLHHSHIQCLADVLALKRLLHEQMVHARLCTRVRRILGEQNSNLPRILGILAVVLARGEDLASQATLRRMVTLLQHMRQGLPPQVATKSNRVEIRVDWLSLRICFCHPCP
jgi:hypothetical protein